MLTFKQLLILDEYIIRSQSYHEINGSFYTENNEGEKPLLTLLFYK